MYVCDQFMLKIIKNLKLNLLAVALTWSWTLASVTKGNILEMKHLTLATNLLQRNHFEITNEKQHPHNPSYIVCWLLCV